MPPGVDADQRLHREGLVELDGADVGPADAGPGERLLGGLDRRVAEQSCGSSACAARPAIRATGERPSDSAAFSEPSSTAEAPSLSGEALPAVMVPSLRNDGFSFASDSTLDPARIDSSRGERRCPARRPRGRRRSRRSTPGRRASCERAANASWRSRETSYFSCELLVGLAERDRPLRRHVRVDQPPAERRGDRLDVAGGEGPRRLRQHPRCAGHRLDAAGQHDLRVAGLDHPRAAPWRRRARSRRAGSRSSPAPRPGSPASSDGHPGDVAVLLAGAVGVAEDHLVDAARGRGRACGRGRRRGPRRPGRRGVRRPGRR